jgi:hypothetical protein
MTRQDDFNIEVGIIYAIEPGGAAARLFVFLSLFSQITEVSEHTLADRFPGFLRNAIDIARHCYIDAFLS